MNAVAETLWPHAACVVGRGRFATVRGCTAPTTVYLHETVEQARSALRNIHPSGSRVDLIRCQGRHVLVYLDEPLDPADE